MVNCPNGHPLGPGAFFCSVCGADTRIFCPNGHTCGPDARYCQTCQATLTHATVMSDPASREALLGSTAPTAGLASNDLSSAATTPAATEPGTQSGSDDGTALVADPGAASAEVISNSAGSPLFETAFGLDGGATEPSPTDTSNPTVGADVATADLARDEWPSGDGGALSDVEPSPADEATTSPSREAGEKIIILPDDLVGDNETIQLVSNISPSVPTEPEDPLGTTSGYGSAPDVDGTGPDVHDVSGQGGAEGTTGNGNKKRWLVTGMVVVLVLIGAVAAAIVATRHSPASTAPVVAKHAKSPVKKASSPTTTPSPTTTTTSVPGGPGGWTYPVAIDQSTNGNESNLTGVACPSAYTCWAVDEAGNILTSTTKGQFSTEATGPSGGLNDIQCPTTTFCAAIGGDNVMVFTGGTWSDPINPDSGNDLQDISCPLATFCLGVDQNGNSVEFTGSPTNWKVTPIAPGQDDGSWSSVSCTSPSFCVAVGNSEGVAIYNGSSWTISNGPNESTSDGGSETASLGEIDCATASFCVAADGSGNVYTYNGSTWSGATAVPGTSTNESSLVISCPASGRCVAANGSGGVSMLNGGTWSPVVQVDGDNQIVSLSCSSPTACTAVDKDNNVLYYTGS
jgi:hypothetical protein